MERMASLQGPLYNLGEITATHLKQTTFPAPSHSNGGVLQTTLTLGEKRTSELSAA